MNALLVTLLLGASMNLAPFRSAVKALVTDLTGMSDAGAVEWKGTKEAGHYRKWPRCNLSIRSIHTVSEEELQEYNEDDDTLDRTNVGHVEIRVTMRFESDNQADAAIAETYATRLQRRLMRKSTSTTLNAVGASVGQAFDVINADYKLQDRFYSASIVDVVFNAVDNDADTSADGNYIQSVIVESNTLNRENDAPAETQIEMTVELDP